MWREFSPRRLQAETVDRLLAAVLLAWALFDVPWWWRPPGHGGSAPAIAGVIALAAAQSVPFLRRRQHPAAVLALAYPNDEWQRKGATLSDKTARQEFGLTQDEIYDAIDAGTLQYRQAHMHGNPWLRLLRREVEALARARHGDSYVSEQQARAELTRVNREIRRLRTELAELEERRARLGSDLGE